MSKEMASILLEVTVVSRGISQSHVFTLVKALSHLSSKQGLS